MRDYEELVEGWKEIIENLRDKMQPDLDNIQHLIFETYHFYKNELKGDCIPRNRVELYKLVAQFEESLGENYYSVGMKESLVETCNAFAAGLCYVVENGFDCCYGANSIPISLNIHVPAGCADLEADMTTYESFLKAFDENVEWLREEYEEDFDE